ncbi:MAG: TRAP transporter substrate-binding protein [Nitratireductor sp.]|nr:TRAP transporter substrate-binding protein [Nitratireductor sp.]
MTNSNSKVTRRQVLNGALGVAGAAVLCAPAIARAQTPTVFRIATTEAIGSPMTVHFDKAADLIRDRSEGSITVEHYPAGQLGSVSQLLQNNRIGSVPCTSLGFDVEGELCPEITALALGFLIRSSEHLDKIMGGDLGQELSDAVLKRTGVEYTTYGERGYHNILSTRKVETLEELQGLKIRTPESDITLNLWKNLGASPTPLSYVEQYNALSTGLIEGMSADPEPVKGYKWYEIAKHYAMSRHWYLLKAVRMNGKWINSLPQEKQDIIRSSLREAFAGQRQVARESYFQTLEELKAQGVEINEIADIDAWHQKNMPVIEAYVEKYPSSKDIVEKVQSLA